MPFARNVPALLAYGLLCLAFLALTGGCGGKRPISGPRGPAALEAPLEEADRAWNSVNMQLAESLYGRLLEDGRLPPDIQTLVYKRYSLSTVANGHYHLALETLPLWRERDPGAVQDKSWQDAYIKALKGLAPSSASTQGLEDIFNDIGAPWRFRARAGLALSEVLWNAGDVGRSLSTLAQTHQDAEAAGPVAAQEYRAWLEQSLWDQLRTMDLEALKKLSSLVPESNRLNYPYTIVRLETARRLAEEPGGWPQGWAILRELAVDGQFADAGPVQQLLESLEQSKGTPLAETALALPLSGPYAEFSWKILRGASTAQWELLQNGSELHIRVVNTEAPDWVSQINALPESVTIVGGPLQRDSFLAAHNANATARKAFFTFLPGLPKGEEGKDAWRFFPSSMDQVRSLLDFMESTLGFGYFGILYPDEPFGRLMAQKFEDEVIRRSLDIAGSYSYNLNKVEDWGSSVKTLLESKNSEIQAVFLPDGWAQAELLIPYFFFHSMERCLFLGTNLWSQTLTKKSNKDMRNFQLAVFPAPFNPDSETRGLQMLQDALDSQALGEPDFWVALGYDFIRFVHALDTVDPNRNEKQMNTLLSGLQFMDFSMAPLEYLPDGSAIQHLYLFQPTASGMAPLDVNYLLYNLEKAHQRQEWVEMTEEERKLRQEEQKRTEPTNQSE